MKIPALVGRTARVHGTDAGARDFDAQNGAQ
jgi:hypothetical protein